MLKLMWSAATVLLELHGHVVAQHSLHVQAMAIDIRIPGVPAAELRDPSLFAPWGSRLLWRFEFRPH